MIGNAEQIIQYLFKQEKEQQFEINEFKQKRNKDQNSKYWTLLKKLALKLMISFEEVHFELLKKASPQYEVLVPKNYEIRGIEYYYQKGILKKGEKEFKVIRVLTPSHEMNTKEFALLLQTLCEECKANDIETLSKDELLELEAILNGI